MKDVYVPSDYVREDGGVHAERKNLPLAWAVQKQGRIIRGRFWAFFPTETQTTVSGILNAPWKTNEDRQNLLPGPFNEEFIEKAAELVVDNLPQLWSAEEPARHLDLLPSRDSYNWADKLLGERVFALCDGRPVVPNQDGTPTVGAKLNLHPEGLSTKVLAMWASYDGRPRDWVHQDAETVNRRARVERLIPRHNLASHAAWLEALVADRTRGRVRCGGEGCAPGDRRGPTLGGQGGPPRPDRAHRPRDPRGSRERADRR